MKKHLHYKIVRFTVTLLLILCCQFSQAATYYFSSSQGDDSRSMQQAQNPSTPWRSLAKLNAIFSSLNAGDIILFNRGEVFEGAIVASKSGVAGNPIVFSAYGTGAKPIISGFVSLGNWVNVGNGVWEARLASQTAVLNMVTVNNVPQAMGRYPNANAANRGYLIIDSYSGNTQITDSELSGTPNWTGGEVVIRKNRWIIDRNKITNHSGTTIYYTSASFYNAGNKHGYFIQNHPATLDSFGEWYYNKSAGTFRMFFGSAHPSSYQIRASVKENNVTLNKQSYMRFDNITFQGSNFRAFPVENTTGITIINSEILFSGGDAIGGTFAKDVTLENSVIMDSYNNAIGLPWECPGATVKNNRIQNTGHIIGMGQSGDFTYQAILTIGHNAFIEGNTVINTGCAPISFRGNNAICRFNFIDTFAYIKDDAGAIHTWNNMSGNVPLTGQKVTDNIIMNGVGAPEGTANPDLWLSMGIYLDDNTANMEVARNTVTRCGKGMYIHNAHNNSIHSNTLFDNREYQLSMEHDMVAPDKPIRNIAFKNNILATKGTRQSFTMLRTKESDIALFGSFDNNYYTRTTPGGAVSVTTITRQYTSSQVRTVYTLDRWKPVFGFETNSIENKLVPNYKINSLIGANKFPNKSFDSNINGVGNWSPAGNLRTEWDNTNKLDGGSLKVHFATISGNTGVALASASVGAVEANKKYILRFSVIGVNAHRNLDIALQNNNSPYQDVVRRSFKSTSGRTDYEMLLEPSTSITAARLRFDIYEPDGTIWLDNIELYEADVTVDPEHVRLEYNATNAAKTVSLNGITYVNAKGEVRSGSLTLAPFASEVLIKQSTDLTVVAPLVLTTTSKDATCYGQSTGAASVIVTGGVAPYSYAWSNGKTTAQITDLAAGNYTVTITDKTGSKKTATVSLAQPSAIVITEKVTAQTAQGQDGSIELTVSGGTGAYSYKWSTGATTKDLSGLAAGSYSVTVTDANGCSSNKTIPVTQTLTPALVLTVTSTDVTCNESRDGIATAVVTGGATPYSYTWSNGKTTAQITDLAAGNYTVTVTDAQGAKESKTIIIAQPYAITITESVIHESIAGKDGSIELTVSGGTGAYSYKWSTGATTKDLSGLAAGSYSVTVTDANGCSNSKTMVIEQTPANPIIVTYTYKDASCYESATGSITLSVTGGVAPYSYAWSNGKTTAQITDLAAGNYTVTVTDAQDTKQTKTITVGQATAIIIDYTTAVETAQGKDGSIELTVSGGTGAYSYKWSTGATTKDLSGLAAGSYSVTVTDANGCTANMVIVVEKSADLTVVAPLVLTTTSKDATCYGQSTGAASVTVTGGVAPYSYTWSNGKTTAQITDLVAGNYTVTVTDKTGSKKTATVSLAQPSAIVITEKVTAQTAQGKDGSIELTVSGGTGAYSYKWSTGATTKDLSGLAAGSYSVTVTDANGCSSNSTISLRQQASLASIQSFTLLNGQQNHVLAKYNPLADQDTINLSLLPSRLLNIRANTSNDAIASVSFSLNRQPFSSDATAPFYLSNGQAWTPAVGKYELTATAYTKDGQTGGSLTIRFYIIDQPVAKKAEAIEPLLSCVKQNEDGTLTAYFGYVNHNKQALTIAAGADNRLSSLPLEGSVLERFEPGRQERAFSVSFAAGTSLQWLLTGPDGEQRKAEVKADSPVCAMEATGIAPRVMFSPNEDGIDDLWQITNIEQYPDYEVVVFNRNGRQVYQAKPYSNNWDGRFQGKPLMPEAYFFVIRNKKETIKTGSVTIIR